MNSLNGLKHEKGQNKNKNFRHSTTLRSVRIVEMRIKLNLICMKEREF